MQRKFDLSRGIFSFFQIGSGAYPYHPRPREGRLPVGESQPQTNPIDFNQANSMQDIGRKLLQSVGFASPDELSIQAAIEANDVFIAQLEQIRDRAQGLTIDQDD
jgi:hypothetical protein